MNTYSGGTTVQSGTLQGAVGSVQGDLINNGSVIFDQAENGIYGWRIWGSGSIVKEGKGLLTLSGDLTYRGATIIREGLLSSSHLGADGLEAYGGGFHLRKGGAKTKRIARLVGSNSEVDFSFHTIEIESGDFGGGDRRGGNDNKKSG